MKLSHLSKMLGASAIAASVTLLSSGGPVLAQAQYEEGTVNEYPSESSESVQPTSPGAIESVPETEYDSTAEQNLDRAVEEARDSVEATGAAATQSLESARQAAQQNANSAVQQIESAADEAQRNIEATSQQAQQQMAETAQELEERANWGWLGLTGLLGLFGLLGLKKDKNRYRDTEVRYETNRHSEPFPHETEATRTTTTTNSNRTL